jgi:hypothetical protein
MGRIVIAAYKAKPGKAAELRRLMRDHLSTLRAQQLVTDRLSILMQAKDGTIVEVFEWFSREAIESAHSNPVVREMWRKYEEVCEYVPIGEVEEAGELFSEFSPLE